MPPELHLDPAGLDLTRILADQAEIRRVNAQRFEMEQLTAVVLIDRERHLFAGYKDVGTDEFWVKGHMPGYPLFPGVLMCEAAAQLCSYYMTSLNLLQGDFIGFGGLENVRFRVPVRPGDRLVLIGKTVRINRRQTVCNVQGFVGSTMVFHADILGVALRKGGGVSVRRRRLPLEELAPYLLELPDGPGVLDWRQVFGNDRPVEAEVGFGKGLFLLTAAQAIPDLNLLGIEVARKYQLFTATRLVKRHLAHVRLACADARLFFRDRVAAGSLRAIHVYFPDPWWKKRHLKRRVFTPEFVAQCERVLAAGGRLHLATDVEEYFRLIVDLFAKHTRMARVPVEEAGGTAEPLTNFERKFCEEGRAIFRAVYEPTGSS